MKFTLLAFVRLVSSTPAFVGNPDDNTDYSRLGLSDPDYTFEDIGYCMASIRAGVPLTGPWANYYHVGSPVNDATACANTCRNYDLTGQIGFSMSNHGQYCMCEYSFGWGPDGALPELNPDHDPDTPSTLGSGWYFATYGLNAGSGGTGPPVSEENLGYDVSSSPLVCFKRNDYVYTTFNVSVTC